MAGKRGRSGRKRKVSQTVIEAIEKYQGNILMSDEDYDKMVLSSQMSYNVPRLSCQ